MDKIIVKGGNTRLSGEVVTVHSILSNTLRECFHPGRGTFTQYSMMKNTHTKTATYSGKE